MIITSFQKVFHFELICLLFILIPTLARDIILRANPSSSFLSSSLLSLNWKNNRTCYLLSNTFSYQAADLLCVSLSMEYRNLLRQGGIESSSLISDARNEGYQ